MRRKIDRLHARAPPTSCVRYDWPGNVRELENAIERAVALARGSRIEVDDLPEELRVALPRPRPMGQTRPLDEVEREYILAAVETAGGNRTRAAAQLEHRARDAVPEAQAVRGVGSGRSGQVSTREGLTRHGLHDPR